MTKRAEVTGTFSRVWFWEAEAMVMTDITSPPDVTHRHVAVQLVLSLGEPIGIWTEQSGWVRARGTIVATDVEHGVDSGDEIAFGGWIDPRSRGGRALARTYLGEHDVAVLSDERVDRLIGLAPRLPEALDVSYDGRPRWDRLLAMLIGEWRGQASPDPRVIEVLGKVEGATHLPRVQELASAVGLSVSRLQHLIRAETGLSLRRWVLWRRTISATDLLLRGGWSVADAAHMAGFADAAHFTRSFVSFFAFPPSIVAGDPRFVGTVSSRLEVEGVA
ncbi:MAG: helix-turn-helix domain-containing protein [Actinomycetota bacterium]